MFDTRRYCTIQLDRFILRVAGIFVVMRIETTKWVLLWFIFTGWGMLSSCVVRYPVVGKFENASEVFRGRITARSHPEKGSIEIKGEVTKVKCVGRSKISYAPPGKEGRVGLACQDGRRILVTYRVIAWGKGYGTGTDQDGNRFIFTFGMPDGEARKYFRESEP